MDHEQGQISDTPDAAPIKATERIIAIDALRGFALLGILVMNIPSFVISDLAFFNPPADGGFEGLDYLTWLLSHAFFELKMMAIFSMLFGAGIVIFTQRAESKHPHPTFLFYRRLFWLLVIGMVHAYLIWFGDILVPYAIIGGLAFLFRKLSPKILIPLAVAIMSVAMLFNAFTAVGVHFLGEGEAEYQAALDAGEPITDELFQQHETWANSFGEMVPTPEVLEKEAQLYKGGTLTLLKNRAEATIWWQTMGLGIWGIWRIGGLMLLGMALYKLGVLSAKRSTRFYITLAAIGYPVGLGIIALGVQYMHAKDFELFNMFLLGFQYNYVGSLLVALAHIAVVMLLVKHKAIPLLTHALSAVGQMAFTNYLMHSIICAFIFYPWGLGHWGDLSRAQLIPIVLIIWLFQLFASPLWLRHFRFGPAEWFWRSLTYAHPQKMRR